ncbi:MAG: MAPEG family protein [Rhodospirillales bacterium]
MTVELEMLAWTAIITLLFWIPYILAHIANVGIMPALTYKADSTPLPAWAARAKKAHYNAIENLAPFAALVVAAHLAGVSNEATQSAAVAYFWLRAAHYPLYVFGVPFGRTLTFAGGWLAQLCIAYQLIVA